jgi:hypothetical protein
VHYFLGGSSGSECGASHRLCVPVERYGKAEVMQLSNGGLLPRFSKYCGAVEWRNCVYLWVNVGGSSGYSNAFSEEGRHMMWFGGSRMHAGECLLICLMYRYSYMDTFLTLYLCYLHLCEQTQPS